LSVVLGIAQSSTIAGQTVSQNVVHSLSSTAASAALTVTGIYYSGNGTSGSNVIARNLVHSLSIASASPSSQMNGMRLSGFFSAQNNMVRVGVDGNGTGTAGASNVNGIFDGSGTAHGFYHNSVHVGGAQTSGTSNTFAFTGTAVNNTRDFRNNIFVNARSNSGGTGKHYAVQYGGTTTNPAGLTSDNNLLFVNGSGGVLGSYNSADLATLAAWQSATGEDAASVNEDPLLVNAAGTAATVDLHALPGSPANNRGTPIAGVTADYDGQARSATVPDIGADEFISNNADLGALVLSGAALAPVFASGTTGYTTTVTNAVTALTVTPTLADINAAVAVNGASVTSGTASGSIGMSVGTNTVTVLVTAQDGVTQKPYTVSVTRNTVLQDWAAANGVSSDPDAIGANGLANLLNFAFGMSPTAGFSGEITFDGNFGAGGTIRNNGQPITMLEPAPNGVDFRVLYVRRKDYANAELTYSVEFSPANLTPWTTSAAVPTVLADDGAYQIVSVPFPPFIGGKKARFFRVRITLGP
jgi:hypothetical protein